MGLDWLITPIRKDTSVANRDLALMSVNPINLGGSEALANLAGHSSIIRSTYPQGYAQQSAYSTPGDASYLYSAYTSPAPVNNSPFANGNASAPTAQPSVFGNTLLFDNAPYLPANDGGDPLFTDYGDFGGFFNGLPGGAGNSGGGSSGGGGPLSGAQGGVSIGPTKDDSSGGIADSLAGIYKILDGFFFGGLLPGGVDPRSILVALIGATLLILAIYALVRG